MCAISSGSEWPLSIRSGQFPKPCQTLCAAGGEIAVLPPAFDLGEQLAGAGTRGNAERGDIVAAEREVWRRPRVGEPQQLIEAGRRCAALGPPQPHHTPEAPPAQMIESLPLNPPLPFSVH